jgi:hippurate hydrolase
LAVAIRADIDAIAETERTERPDKSLVPGLMHGCGHDLHTVAALGAAAILADRRDELLGDVYFIFQPAEEVTGGAAALLEHGLLRKLPAVPLGLFGLHSWPMARGLVGARGDAVAAGKTNFRIKLTGKGGQGGFPHECVDPVVAAAALIAAIQTIVSRNADPRKSLVCAVYNMIAGDREFFVTDTVTLSGSVRALDPDTLEMAIGRLRELTDGVAAAYRCKAEMELLPQVPVLLNDPSLTQTAREGAGLVVGDENVLEPAPMLGSDDFSVYCAHMPVFYYQLGVTRPGAEPVQLHSPYFYADPEAAPIGAALLAQAAALSLTKAAKDRP